MLPEGTQQMLSDKLAGALPEGMGENIGEGIKMFNQAKDAFEQFKGITGGDAPAPTFNEFEDFEELMAFEEEDLSELKFFGGESNASFEERKAERQKYVDQCNVGKAEFKKEIDHSREMLVKLRNHDFV